ncbi:MAG: DUF4339 domain-containing protein [Limisphaerales bacterium]
MANYIIIGGDGKEYGPISDADVRKWISEGRLNAQSLAKAESDAEFRPLSNFPEFADAFGIAPPPLNAPPPFNPAGEGDGRAAALQMVKSPAIALKVTAILNLILALWSLADKIFTQPNLQQFNSAMQQLNNPQMQAFMQKLLHIAYGPFGVINELFCLAISILIWMGATKMQSLRSYEFAFTAAILAMIPCLTPCCLLGLPFGIWVLVVLSKPEVKTQFS